MNAAIIRKTMRDTILLLTLCLLALLVFEVLFVAGMHFSSGDIRNIIERQPFLQRMLKALVGADLGEYLTPTGLMTIGFVHPFLLAMNWTLLLTTCTRVISGEVDRGTADLVMSLPVSRAALYASVSLVWVLCGIPVSLVPLAGVALGERFFPLWEPVNFSRLAVLTVNLYAMYLAVGAATMLVSSGLSRRGPAIGLVLTGLLISVIFNFLAQFWQAADRIGYFGLLYYYKPLPIVRSGEWPTFNLTVLGGAALLAWSAGLWHFSRRDIPTA